MKIRRIALAAGVAFILASNAFAQTLTEPQRLAQCVLARAELDRLERAANLSEYQDNFAWTDADIEAVRGDIARLSNAITNSPSQAQALADRLIDNYDLTLPCDQYRVSQCPDQVRTALQGQIRAAQDFRAAHPAFADEFAILTALRCETARGGGRMDDPARWAGVFSNGKYEYTLVAAGGVISANSRTVDEDNTGRWSNCRPEGVGMTCDASGTYKDMDKTITWSGFATSSLAGDALNETTHIVTTQVQWTTDSRYTPSISPGAEFALTLPRKGR